MTMCTKCLEMVVYDPAAEQQHGAAKRLRPSLTAAEAGAVVPCDAAPPPADVQPLDAVPWQSPAPPAPQLSAARFEPVCLRSHVLPALRLRSDLPMHFIDEKIVTCTDLDAHQNRFRIPTNGLQRLRKILTPEELDSANLLYDLEPRAKPPKELPEPAKNSAGDAAGSSEQPPEEQKKKNKKRGRVHGGLPVRLVYLAAGASSELRLSRWESSHAIIIKGEGYLDFIRRCSFKEKDVVEIWAFKQRSFRYFGVTMCDDSILHLFIVKREDTPKTCRFCPLRQLERK